VTDLNEILSGHLGGGSAPGAVALVARGDQVEVRAVGSAAVGGPPMARDTIFRIASLTKPISSAAAMMLVEDGVLALEDQVTPWLPELAEPLVVRTPEGPLDDVVPAARPVTVDDLLTFRAGWGFPSDFSVPAIGPLFSELKQGTPLPEAAPPPDEWMARLARIPMLYQPGERWLYSACSDILGVLIARASGRSLPEFLAERIFEPLGMADTGFMVPEAERDRFASFYRSADAGGLELVDAPDGQWSRLPAFPAAGGGLVSTADDWYAFARMMTAGGEAGGRRLLSPESVRLMTTDQLTGAQRDGGRLFLEGQGWGFGGSVDVAPVDPWNVPGRYGWVGGTGTTAHLVRSTGLVSILLTQLQMTSPTPTPLMRAFWGYAAGVRSASAGR
jgi:CubicO group peptidase (beta-lactamase class C family)